MEVIALINVVQLLVDLTMVNVSHPSYMRQRQFPRVLNLEHLEDGAEVSIRPMSWSNCWSLLFQRMFWVAIWLGCCKWRAMWWIQWGVYGAEIKMCNSCTHEININWSHVPTLPPRRRGRSPWRPASPRPSSSPPRPPSAACPPRSWPCTRSSPGSVLCVCTEIFYN